ncbi:MAG: GTP-binding protein [Thermoplasmata archaeon]|nr:GTP-binding protein [Thermoplasmata archaeon]
MAKKLMKKICLLGDGAVGKTSLIKKFVFDSFDDKYIKTFGTKVTKKLVTLNQQGEEYNLTFLIWDILGQRVHNNLHSTYYKGAAGAFIVCDVTRKETMDNLEDWIGVFRGVNPSAPLVLLGNKSDLLPDRGAADAQIKAVADKFNVPYHLTSAKTGDDVEESFDELGTGVVEAFIAGRV